MMRAMGFLRSGVVVLLAVLQLLAPYLHAHAAPSRVGGWHLHAAALAPVHAAQAAQAARAGVAASAAQPMLAAPGDSAAAEMPVEWLRDPCLPVLPETGWRRPRAPPAASACCALPWREARVDAWRPPRFAVLGYPAAAPPLRPMPA